MKISPEIKNMIPYKPGKPISETRREYGVDKVYKLASNENPLGPSPKALQAIQKELGELHRYPDPSHYDLITTLSQLWNLSPAQIAIGNGSDEILDILIRIYCEPQEGILIGESAFAAYEVSAQAARAKFYKVPLRPDFTFNLPAMCDFFFANPDKKIHLLFIPNPNNPTGTIITKSKMEELFAKLGNREDVLLVFDEAYNEFVRSPDYVSAQNYLATVNNLIVLRTFSKAYGLAGLRVGALLGPQEVIEVFNRVRKPFNVNSLAQVAVIAALQDKEFIEASRQLTWNGLDYFYKELKKMGLPFVESQANFVMFDTLRDASKVYQALLKKGLILRPILNYGFPRHLRLSVGLEVENQAVMQALPEVLKEIPQCI